MAKVKGEEHGSDILVVNVEEALMDLAFAKSEVRVASVNLKLALKALGARSKVDPHQRLLGEG